MYDDDERPAPPAVVAAAGVGTVPLPFLAVYAVIFLVHGTFHPVVPPDITTTKDGELACGIVATAIFVVSAVALIWALSGRRRWPFATVQAAFGLASLYFLIDPTIGGTLVSTLMLIIAVVVLALLFVPQSWPHYGRPAPAALQALLDRRTRRADALPSADAAGLDPGAVHIGHDVPGTVSVVTRPRPPLPGDAR